MLDHQDITDFGFRAVAPKPLPISRMMVGKPVDDVVELLPRLFNLCRHAQSVAAQMAVGWTDVDCDALAQEIRDDHILKLGVMLPTRLGFAPLSIDRNTPHNLPEVLFGETGMATTHAEFDVFLRQSEGIAPFLRSIRDRFQPGEACSVDLPFVCDANIMSGTPVENSVAARHSEHLLLQSIGSEFGRGPLWRAVGRAIDLHAVLHGNVPKPRKISAETAVVPTARGDYAICLRSDAGIVVGLKRVTPTDHMLMPGGSMQGALAALDVARQDQVDLLVDVFDPCVQVSIEERPHA